MPYEVTAARKRPQTFEQLAGQNFVAATLEKSLQTGRIAHAYLFSGPRGCGKTSTARILAKALNCENGPGAEPCGTCASCKAIAAGSSLDVIEIDGASNTSVDNVRQIKDEVLFPPNAGRYKIYIIDEVHMLSTSAFNALLKTIEEPPPYVVFMFATTEPHKVPATIKSRCQQFSFRLVDAETILGLLSEAAAETGVEAEREALLWIARESGGSIRDAYTLFDQVVSFSEGKITSVLIREKLGLVGQDRMNALFGRFAAGDTPGSLASLAAILSGGVSPEQFVADVVEYCRALLLVVNGVAKEGLLGAPLSSFDLSIPEALGEDKIERALSIFLAAYRSLKDSIDPRYELDLAVAKASHLADYISPAELARAVGSLRRFVERGVPPSGGTPVAAGEPRHQGGAASGGSPAAGSGAQGPTWLGPPAIQAGSSHGPSAPQARAGAPAQTAPQTLAQPAAPAPLLDLGDLPGIRKVLVAEIRKNNALLGAALEKSGPWSLEGGALRIAPQSSMECDLLRRFSGIVAEILAQRTGKALRVEFELAERKQGWEGQEARPREGGAVPVFNDGGAGPAAGRPEIPRPNQGPLPGGPIPELSPREKEAVGLVERYFKGSVVGFTKTQAAAPAPAAGPAEQADYPPQD